MSQSGGHVWPSIGWTISKVAHALTVVMVPLAWRYERETHLSSRGDVSSKLGQFA
jgi:hypothetical protein